MTTKTMIGAAVAASAFFAAPLAADVPPFVDSVVSQMTSIIAERATAGWDFRQGAMGHIDRGRSIEHDLRTDWMKTTEVRAWCDADCSDVDLEVYTSNGELAATDLATDDHPVVTFEPQPGIRYRARVIMAACAQDPCYYSMAAFTPR